MKPTSVVMAVVGIWIVLGCSPSNPEAESAATQAAASWMTLIDAERYSAGWEASGGFFREAVPVDKWNESLETVRKPMGANLSRKVKSAVYKTRIPDAPEGEYVSIKYESSFQNQEAATEWITLMKEANGSWRVAGYNLQAGRSHWVDEVFD